MLLLLFSFSQSFMSKREVASQEDQKQ
jgi:hypothetical protein